MTTKTEVQELQYRTRMLQLLKMTKSFPQSYTWCLQFKHISEDELKEDLIPILANDEIPCCIELNQLSNGLLIFSRSEIYFLSSATRSRRLWLLIPKQVLLMMSPITLEQLQIYGMVYKEGEFNAETFQQKEEE